MGGKEPLKTVCFLISAGLWGGLFDSLFVEHYVEYFLIGFAHTLAGKLAY